MPVAGFRSIVERTVSAMGYEVIEVEMAQRGLLRVFIDSPAGIRMEDCERVSHQLSHVFAVEDFDYQRLEVSSPGVDRPLRHQADFVRFAGEQVTLKLRMAFKGRRNFEGTLTVEPDGQFGLVLIDEAERQAAAQSAGKARSKVSGRIAAARKAAARKTAVGKESVEAGVAGPGESGDPVREKLVFSLDEVERARLVPKLKF